MTQRVRVLVASLLMALTLLGTGSLISQAPQTMSAPEWPCENGGCGG